VQPELEEPKFEAKNVEKVNGFYWGVEKVFFLPDGSRGKLRQRIWAKPAPQCIYTIFRLLSALEGL